MMAGYRRVNYYELCRLCTSSEGTKMHIFREEGRRRSLPTKIQTCLPLHIQEEDSLPKIICNTCVEKLESYFEFREACLNAEAMLESYFTNLKYSDDLNKEGKVSVYVRDEIVKKKDESTSMHTPTSTTTTTSSSSSSSSSSSLSSTSMTPSKAKVKISVSNTPTLTTLNTVTTVSDGNTIIPSAIQILADPEMSTRLTQYKVQVQGGIPSLVPYVDESLPLSVSIPALTPQPVKQQSTSNSLRSEDAIPTSCESVTIPPPPPLVAAVAIAPPNQDLLQQLELASKDRNGITEVLKLKNINILEQCEPVIVTSPSIHGTSIAGQVPNIIPAPIRIDQNQFQEFLNSNIQMNLSQVQSNQTEEVQKKSVGTGTGTTRYLVVKTLAATKVDKQIKKEPKEQQTNIPVMIVNGTTNELDNQEAEVNGTETTDDNTNDHEQNDESQKNSAEDHQGHECPTCFKTFWRKEHLNQHKKSHSGERPFVCTSCPKAFSRKEHLLRHSFSHSGQKLYKCDVCKKNFSRKDNLHKHKKTHGINGPYVCEICGRSFVVKHYYQVHMAQHDGYPNTENVKGVSLKPLVTTESLLNPLPYKCDQCPKSFSSKNYMNTHRLRHRQKATTSQEQRKQEKKLAEKKSQSTETQPSPQSQEQSSAQEQSSSEFNMNPNTELAIAQTQPAIITSFPAATSNLNLTALNTQLTTINPNALIASNIIHSPSTNVVHIGNNSYLCTPNVTSELLEQYRRIHTTV